MGEGNLVDIAVVAEVGAADIATRGNSGYSPRYASTDESKLQHPHRSSGFSSSISSLDCILQCRLNSRSMNQ